MKRGKKRIKGLLLVCLALFCLIPGISVQAGTLYESSYVSFSPDGQAWTVREELPYYEVGRNYIKLGEMPEYWYEKGYVHDTGISSALRGLNEGEHYYGYKRYGEIPVGYWEVNWTHGRCIHNSSGNWHGVPNSPGNCGRAYPSGWVAYCADCGQEITAGLTYMTKEAVESITSIDVDLGYWYTCTYCTHIDQTYGPGPHNCENISFNKYKVVYDKNANGSVRGYMFDSFHMYNNETMYEGQPVTPQTKLTKNSYGRIGYTFTGWNTKRDGSGTQYEDGADILNLSVYDYKDEHDRGVVTLYAQWKKSESTLRIDPAGGTYDGNSGVFSQTMGFGSNYCADPSKVVGPGGFKVSFDTHGGNTISPMNTTSSFNSWKLSEPFNGYFDHEKNTYYFEGTDGSVDTLTATYDGEPIILPTPVRDGYSFGGWFEDTSYKTPVGFGGDKYTPKKDVTLHAKWTELVLWSYDNYVDNNRKGAVDLKWYQPDSYAKSYKIYESSDGENFTLIKKAADNSDVANASGKDFSYRGASEVYTIPYTGFYTLTTYGAQGKGYATFVGGRGGFAEGKFYLNAGDKLTVAVGGQNGFNGGGTATTYGNGGGATTIKSAQKGVLLIAGGGGGAAQSGNGGAGGESTSLTTTMTGGSGMAGGGGGHQGGNAGEYILHAHKETCYIQVNTNLLDSEHGHLISHDYECWHEEYDEDGDDVGLYFYRTWYGSKNRLTDVVAGAKLDLEIWQNIPDVGDNNINNSFIEVFDQNGNCFYKKYGGTHTDYYVERYEESFYDDEDGYTRESVTWTIGPVVNGANGTPIYTEYYDEDLYYEGSSGSAPSNIYLLEENFKDLRDELGDWLGTFYYYDCSTSNWGEYGNCFAEEIIIPQGVTGIYIRSSVDMNENPHSIYQNNFLKATVEGKQLICGMVEGQVESSKPAYGGSNYVNAAAIISEKRAGLKTTNGSAAIKANAVGFTSAQEMKAVPAPDLAAPDKVSADSVDIAGDGDMAVKVTFAKPKDNGTQYWYRCESYYEGSETKICDSNITTNTLTTGVDGYLYIVDTTPARTVTAQNAQNAGNLLRFANGTDPSVRVLLATDIQYLHIAAVDVAGNVGPTLDIKLEPAAIAWNLMTDQIGVTDVINGNDLGTVHPKGTNSYYVRADGKGAFMMSYKSYLKGTARDDYQINYQIFDSRVAENGAQQRYITQIPYSIPITSTANLDVTQFVRQMTGDAVLKDASNTGAHRERSSKDNFFNQAFSVPYSLHGKEIVVTPVVGATYEDEIIYSDWANDTLHSVTLIPDGVAPVISGAEVLESMDVIDPGDGSLYLTISATDDLSGVRDLKVTVTNADTGRKGEFTPDANGLITLDMTPGDSLFGGNLLIKITSTDNVGNVSTKEYGMTEFNLTATIGNANNPSINVCKHGETAVLTAITYGYADKVVIDVPSELEEGNEDVQLVYDYPHPGYIEEEIIPFVVPLYCDDKEYEFIVRAYKDGREIIARPTLIVVEGSVLDDTKVRIK